MKRYNFDEAISRKSTYSTKWDYIEDRFGTSQITPFSISDTDFKTSEEIIEAVNQRVKHGIYGYTRWNHDAFKESIVTWYQKRFYAKVENEWIVYSPSVIYSVSSMIQLLSKVGDTVVTLSPMYDAFYGVIQKNQRVLVSSKLIFNQEKREYQLNWTDLEEKFEQQQVRLFLLTNPHNPTGKVFSRRELVKLVELCHKYDVYLLSDDIHMDIVYSGKDYLPVTEISSSKVVLMTSNSKSFNVPGLIGSYLFIPDTGLREAYLTMLKQQNGLSSVSILGMTAMMAGYLHSEDYVDELKIYLTGNRALIQEFMDIEFPELEYVSPEATYLAWIPVSKLKVSPDVLQKALIEVGKVGIMSGETYGDSDFIRMNFACPKEQVSLGLEGFRKAVRSLNK